MWNHNVLSSLICVPVTADDPVAAKLLSYNRANRAVAVLCNHQRAVPKNFEKQMENIQAKVGFSWRLRDFNSFDCLYLIGFFALQIDAKKDAIRVAKKDLKAAKADHKAQKTERARK